VRRTHDLLEARPHLLPVPAGRRGGTAGKLAYVAALAWPADKPDALAG
jgi:hypothetical protein